MKQQFDEAAAKVAKAGRMNFALYRDSQSPDAEVFWMFNSVKYWKKNGCMIDIQCPVEPYLDEDMFYIGSGSWVTGIENEDPLETAQLFIDAGFQWDTGFQNFISAAETDFARDVQALVVNAQALPKKDLALKP